MGSLALARQACHMTDEPRNDQTPDETPEQPTGPTERMTSGDPLGGDEPPPPPPPPPAAETKRLTRSGKDAVIGGVASGLGRHTGIDPLLFRIGFVVLSFAGGFGVLAYLLLLAFVPADGTERAGGTSKFAAVAGAVVLGVALVTFLGTPFFFFGPGLLVLGMVGLAGVLLWRALGGDPGGDPARTAGRVVLAALLGIAVAGAALGVGLAAALGGGVVIASLAVVTGLVLIGTAFVGGARWLIVPALALVLPLGLVAAADIDLDGGVGDREYRPASMSELRDHYEIGIGGMDVDLRDLELPDGRTDLDVDVGLGEAVVYVPEGACVTSDVEIGAGLADVFDRENDGVDVSFAETATPPSDRPQLHIDANVGVGVIEVVREGSLPDHTRHGGDRFEFFDESQDARFEGGTGCA
jgi:phage shock protein PspC (stress-responsive transcriptional regulator)